MLCRWGYMLLEDPESALRDTRRILKQDGRLALAAWTGPDDNLWSAAPTCGSCSAGIMEPPQGPGQFTWADPNLIVETMEAAGFIEPEIEAIDFVMRFARLRRLVVAQSRRRQRHGRRATSRWTSPPAATCWPISSSVAEPFTQPDDRLEIPARTWIATATA